MKIDIYSNEVHGGWLPERLASALGGSEEVLALFARTLAGLGHDVAVFHTRPPGAPPRALHDHVHYLARHGFRAHDHRDVLITWKDPTPWRLGASAAVRLHWSSDVERPWADATLRRLHAFVCLTDYHRRRMPWLPESLARVIPHGVDLAHLDAQRGERVDGLALYCSAPDRGLERVLRDWPMIQACRKGMQLAVTYGWAGRMPGAFEQLLDQPGVRFLGAVTRDEMAALYWGAEWWLLPLVRGDAELFCLNAVKAKYCGATPVSTGAGALMHTARPGLDYSPWVQGHDVEPDLRREIPIVSAVSWETVIQAKWLPLIEAAAGEVAA